MVVEGEAGIGKTTLWLDTVERARQEGFRVLSARPAAAESGMAYASLTDLVRGVEAAILDRLPEPQRVAVDQILVRTSQNSAATDQRAVGAAFLSIVERLGDQSPVLIAIDDLHWLDRSSRLALAFVTRRLATGVGVLCTHRTGPESDDPQLSWLELPEPDSVERIQLGPLSLGALHKAVSERLARSFPRPAMVRIHEVSRGNPFYAIEIAREIDSSSPVGEVALPRTLSGVVQSRFGTMADGVRNALLAIACQPSATLDQLVRATGIDSDHLVELLEQAETQGIIEIAGDRRRFTHPLLARGVYDSVAPAQRRKMHRRLAQVVNEPELRARHLALGATHGDETTLHALDAAAESARTRGAPAAAAELLELAMRLGGDTLEYHTRTAAYHLEAGDLARARHLLEEAVPRLPPGESRATALHTAALVRLHDDSWAEAANLLRQGLDEAAENALLRVRILVTLSYALLNAGQLPDAVRTVEQAVTGAEEVGDSRLLALALGMRAMVLFIRGDGFDETGMRRALALQDHRGGVPVAFRPDIQNVLLLGWTGHLDHAHEQMLSIRRECMERGEEGELIFVGFHTVLHAVWRGDVTDAALVAEDTMERALLLGGDLPLFIGLTVQATVAAYGGREDDARRDIAAALAAGLRSSAHTLMQWTIAIAGFLEVSLGDYHAAVATLEPRISALEAAPDCTEIIHASFAPDAVEALIHVGRNPEAEKLIQTLERNGRRLDRAWMSAVGARGRSMLLAAAGDLDAATECAQQAMAQHDRLTMPFERARTQLLLGQLQHRQRHRDAAAATLTESLATFERLDTALWAEKARASLARTDGHPARTGLLTTSERRVAELAASGMTNRDVAAALFISVKTVEVNLTRIYRKLGIHSRAELGRRIDRLET